MPGRVIVDPLTVEFVLPGESEPYLRRMDDIANQRLAADIAIGLAGATHPHGPIRARSAAEKSVSTMKRMARDLATGGFTGSLSDLSTASIVRYWLTCDYQRELRIRQVLRAFHEVGGQLHPGIVAHLNGRRINRETKSKPYAPYSEGEWQRLADEATGVVNASAAEHRALLQAAERGSQPQPERIVDEDLAWLMCRIGPTSIPELRKEYGLRPDIDQHTRVMRGLFPEGNLAFAFNTLFAMRTGIVPDGIDSLTTGSFKRTSPSTMIASYRKGRRGDEALNLPRDAVRLLEEWLVRSALLRRHAGGRAGHLWLHIGSPRRWQDRSGSLILTDARAQNRRRAWMRTAGVVGDDGNPLAVHGGRVRATYHHRRDRANWTGRTTIDPNHSAKVEGDHYLTSHTPAQRDAIDSIIEEAQSDLRRKALPAVVLTSDDAASFTEAFPRMVEQAGLDHEGIGRLLSGEQDVFVASCAGPMNSPHAPPGVLCPARPWVCLLCPLAAFSQRHLPNLLRLREYFSGQSRRMTAGEFLSVFGPYDDRLTGDILPRFDPAAVAAAAREMDGPGGFALNLEELPS